jgi:Flp pilus assembly protein TadD
VICLFYCNCSRYEVEFLLPLMVLAVLGIFGLERALASRPRARAAARWGWGLLLAFSVAFNLLASADHYATEHADLGRFLLRAGRAPEALAELRRAAAVRPSAAAHYSLAGALDAAGRLDEAIAEYQASLRQDPRQPLAHNNLGIALARSRRLPEAAEELQAALRLQPDYGEAMANLGNVDLLMGRLPEAITQYQGALRLSPQDQALRARLALAERAWEESGR